MQGDQVYILFEDMHEIDQKVMLALADKVRDHFKLTENLQPKFVLMGSFGRDPNDVYAWFEGVETGTPYNFKFRKETSGQAFVDMLEQMQQIKTTSDEPTENEVVTYEDDNIKIIEKGDPKHD